MIDADIFGADLLIHFSVGEPVMFRADFLWQVRNHDDDQPIPASADTDDEPLFVGKEGT